MKPQEQEAEFVSLLEENQNIVHKICRLYTQSEAEHKDLFQEISIQLWRSFDRFEGKSKFTTWMYRVGLNTAITLYRKNKKRLDTYPLNDEISRIELDQYDPVVDEQLNWLYQTIEEFSEIDKALVLLYLEDKRYDPEIIVASEQAEQVNKEELLAALKTLDDRSKDILNRRYLSDEKATLHDLADEYKVSAERIRQIENSALKKLKAFMVDFA